MTRLRTSPQVVSLALKMRTEGSGMRATGRVLDKSHATISLWEQRVAGQAIDWSPPAPAASEVTVEGDEVYTRVGENFPPGESEGWTIHFPQRARGATGLRLLPDAKMKFCLSRGRKLLGSGLRKHNSFVGLQMGNGAMPSICGKSASVYLKAQDCQTTYGYRKVWREGKDSRAQN